MNDYKVCILAAGAGSRMGSISKNINKAVLPINFKAVISYIVEKFPENIEVVIAVGHNKNTVIDYLSVAYPERTFKFVTVDKYLGPGTGPGYSLLACKDELRCPFIFFAADTIVIEEIPPPTENWFGIAPIKETEKFCTVKIKNNWIYQIDDKIKCDNKYAFIGLAGVKDHEEFFNALEKNKNLVEGEIQVSNGFKKLIEKKLKPIGFTWFDTGSMKNYKETNTNFSGGGEDFDFSKGDEFLYFVNGRVIKFFADEDITNKRVERAKMLEGLSPKIENKRGHFYAYKKLEGQTLYNVLNNQLTNDFTHWAKQSLWNKMELNEQEYERFKVACRKFYHDKTMKRLEMFYEKTGISDTDNTVNGTPVPSLKSLMAKIDWDYICDGIPSNFHGDLQFDNVLVTRTENSQLPKFVLLDWRQDFGGMTEMGDVYYDLAKMYGGMNLSYQLIKKGMFSFDMSGSSVYFNYFIKNDLLEAKDVYEQFLVENGYDLDKIKLITSIIFLNMSPLHNDPFDLMLYFLGKAMLNRTLNSINNRNTLGVE